MRERSIEIHDVLIVGAGPVGLFLACELALAEASVLVLEASETSHTPLKGLPFGLRGLSLATLDAFDRRGLLDDVAAARPGQPPAHWAGQSRKPAGHFGGVQFFQDRVDASRWGRGAESAPTGMAVTLEALEDVLAARAQALGVKIRRGAAVSGLEASAEAVTVLSSVGPFHGRWLVGCDGGRSVVRKAAGFTFVGTEPEFTGYSLEAELDDPDALRQGRTFTSTGMYTFAKPGVIALADFDGGAFHRREPITREHAQQVLRRVSQTAVEIRALKTVSTWTDRARQAAEYRRGRVLLADDAAHTHSPLGGQGLNLGLGDAMNLGWKLASVARGGAPADLLDTYTAERHPVGADVLRWSRAQVALMRPDRGSDALRAIVHDLADTVDGATYLAERSQGVALRYDLGGHHPLVGRSAPDLRLCGGDSLAARLRTGRPILVDAGGGARLRELVGGGSDKVGYAACEAASTIEATALLVRPDGVVAWVTQDAPDPDEASRALQRWFGDLDST